MPFVFEAKINTEDRNKLPDSAFGIPSKRKYPLTDKDGKLDEKHILQAVRFFNKADDEDKPELAKNILKAAKELDMDYSNWKDVLEAAGEKVVKEYSSCGDDDDADYEEHEPDDCYCESDKERVNDKGEIVPDKCIKCDSPIEIYLKGEPVYLCSNKKCGKYYGTVPCNINESHQMSETEAFYKRWFDIKSKEDLDKAKNIAKQIHEKYESDKQPPCGNQNCMLCTMCAEAQFRGINILPRPVYSPRDSVLKILGESIVKNPIHKSIKSGFDDMLYFATEPKDARWYCHVKWKNGNGGHEFLLLNINQHLYVMDAQQGIVTLNIESEYFKDVDYSESYICRLDNCELNESLLNEVNNPKNTLPWNAVLDIPFMLEEGMLTEEEAEEYWQEHPDEMPVQESKMILNSNDSRIPKLICEGWKIAGTTINNEYILIQEGYDDISLHVSLVPATMSDVPNMEEWEYECMKDAYPNREIPESEVDKLKAELHQDAIDSVHKTRMIQYDGTTIGMLTAYKVLDDEFWFIAEIYLIPEYRGKGIAKYILKNEIDQHDKLILNVYQNNKHAIELYESLGFEITQDGDGRFIMELDKTKKSEIFESGAFSEYGKDVDLRNARGPIQESFIQEGYWQDIKNGVNPKSKKVWFHVSFDDKLDEKGPMIPRIPTWLEEIKKDGYITSYGKKTHDLEEVMKDTGRYENYTTPRVCFSPSIEGALNSIINMWKLKSKDFPGKQLYVYVPEKPISQYKHKTNKELIKDKEVFDAGTTGESWILEPVKVKFYGSIKIDKIKDNGRKHKILIRPGFEYETDKPIDFYIGRFTYKWHWLIHPSILKQGEKYGKSEKKAQSPLEVCNDIVAELKDYKYGIVKDGKLSTSNNSIEDYNKYYEFMTLDEFEKYRGGICYDYVEWEEAYLKDHGKQCKKYYLYADTKYNDTHTFVLVKNDKGFIYIESAFKPIEGVYPVKNLQEALDIITKAMFKMNGNDKLESFKYYVWEYKGHPEYGSSITQCDEFYTKGEPILEGIAMNPKKSKRSK